ncbi:UNVERIFIED_CONTAM: Shewanella-like protein phosphatase 1 [Sesamum calycinum]|uniref:Shewanella-like protein phosphatase 1 n=1 Tax=Sesamum calycinum TaxID=2727403 RepID=A0AAW2JVG2_9LAMI
MASVPLGCSLPLRTLYLSSRQHKTFDAICCCASTASTAHSLSKRASTENPGESLKPIVVHGDPPTFVTAPGCRIVAIGDLHGDLDKARCALQMAGVLSSDGRDLWVGGQTVLVQLGDILDRGDNEIAILSLLKSLDIQAKANGGAVFQVNGNHETMNVEGDFRYVDQGAFDECADFLEHLEICNHNWEEAFISWVGVSERSKKSIICSAAVEYGIERINREVSYWMKGLAWKMIIQKSLLLPPRVKNPELCLLSDPSILQETLQALGAKGMVVGHTPQATGVNCEFNCRIWRIDVGMSRGVLDSRPEVLEIREGRARAIRSKRDGYSELQVVDYT